MREQHAVNAELKSSELLSAYGRKRNGRDWGGEFDSCPRMALLPYLPLQIEPHFVC